MEIQETKVQLNLVRVRKVWGCQMMEIQEPEVQSDSAQVKTELGFREAEVLFDYVQVWLYSAQTRKTEVGQRRIFGAAPSAFSLPTIDV